MLVEPCEDGDGERALAVAVISAYVGALVERVFPVADPDGMATAV
jgi:hypothetical protein